MVTCALGDMASGDVATVLIVTKTPQVSADTTIHDAFAVSAPEDDTPGNDALDVATAVRARRADFVAGYVPASRSTTWLNDATQWSHGDPVATIRRPDRGVRRHPRRRTRRPGHRHRASVRRAVRLHGVCRTNGRSSHAPRGVFGNLIQVSVPSGYGAVEPDHRGLPRQLVGARARAGIRSRCRSRRIGRNAERRCPRAEAGSARGPPCVSSIERSFAWWNPYAFGDLHTVVRFTNGGTFGRGR